MAVHDKTWPFAGNRVEKWAAAHARTRARRSQRNYVGTVAARGAWQALQQAYPDDALLPGLRTLVQALEARGQAPKAAPVFDTHDGLRQARLELQDNIQLAALHLFGPADAAAWLRPFWQDLVQGAARLPFRADCEADHAVPMLLHLEAWQAAADATTRIASWRRIPASLA